MKNRILFVAGSGASVLVTDENGCFRVGGLDTGIFFLEDIKAPAGYNLMESKIRNHVGSTLPITGGVGTKMFYMLGVTLIMISAVFLISRKRMDDENKKSKLLNGCLILILVAGLGLMFYPMFSNYWNERHQTKAIANYIEMTEELDEKDYSAIWESAVEYNSGLLERHGSLALSEKQQSQYNEELNITGNGIMGYIEIPSLDVHLPIYHGTEDTVLQVAVGHIEWSSLPVGGTGTHCVLSGHRGLPSAKLFSDLDAMAEGDYFMLHVLDQVLTYEVDQIRIVEPDNVDDLLIDAEQDLCTLVTCTPYGVNSHRLLVRGHRVDNQDAKQAVHVTSDAVILEKQLVAPFILVIILALILLSTDNT